MPQELLQIAQLLTRRLLSLIAGVSPQLVPYLVGFLTAVLAEPLRQRLFRPRLKVEFLNDTNCISWTREGEMRACYLRIKVRNRKWRLARSCRAYLVNVELRDANGQYQPTSYCDSMQLAWSAAGDQAFSAIDLPRGLTRFVDVVSTRENSENFTPALRLLLYRDLDQLWRRTGEFRFTVMVAGDGIQPKSVKIRFTWTCRWNEFTASRG
jgi:hypothetical protein